MREEACQVEQLCRPAQRGKNATDCTCGLTLVETLDCNDSFLLFDMACHRHN